MASSRPIALGEDYTPGDINNLRADVLDPVGGHKHNGTDGARVPFANLDVVGAAGSTAPPGGSKSYNDLATHVASSQNVHGLGSSGYVLGAANPGYILQAGYSAGAGQRTINFPMQFTQNGSPINPVSVVVTVQSSGDPFSNTLGASIVNLTPSSVVVDTDQASLGSVYGVYWMAMGLNT